MNDTDYQRLQDDLETDTHRDLIFTVKRNTAELAALNRNLETLIDLMRTQPSYPTYSR